jgi:hypothetical protein
MKTLVPPVDKEGKHVDAQWYDGPRCEIVDPRVVEIFPRPAVPSPG